MLQNSSGIINMELQYEWDKNKVKYDKQGQKIKTELMFVTAMLSVVLLYWRKSSRLGL
jgi:hypothetical protein